MKKIFAIIMSALMLVCFMPTMAFAASEENCTIVNCGHKAAIGTTHYATLAEANTAAQDGDTVEIIADVSDETITIDKNLTIQKDASVQAVLDNVTLTAEKKEGNTRIELTLSGLNFSGNSYVNTKGNASKLTVQNCNADVTPSKVGDNGRSAFIFLGTSEATEGVILTLKKYRHF